MKLICNGSKHCLLRDANINSETKLHQGDFAYPDFARDDFDTDRLVIIDNKKQLNFESSFLNTKKFWNEYLNELENK